MQFPELRGSPEGIIYPAWAEVKLDGEATYLIKDGDSSIIYTKTKAMNVPSDRLIAPSDVILPNNMTIFGELVYGEGLRGDLYKILGKDISDNDVHFAPIDILEIDYKDYRPLPFIERKEILYEVFCRLIKDGSKMVNSLEQAKEFFEKTISDGYEGIVIKNLKEPWMEGPCSWAKMKKKDITAFKVFSIDKTRERIELEIPVPNMQGRKVNICGCKCMNKDKALLKPGDLVNIEYQGILVNGGLRHPSYKGKYEQT